MAKKKTEKEVIGKQGAAEVEVQAEAAKSEETAVEEQVEAAPVENKDEIPESVDHILKLFSDYDMLYVAKNGNTYTKDTQPDQRVGAILYKNPYFTNTKNKK